MAPQTSVAIVAEKPSVARDIARVLKATTQGKGYLHGNGYVVTWAIGHLVGLAQPHEIKPEWKAWRRDLLPMIPQSWPLVVVDQTREQFEVLEKILQSPRITSVVCATDAGREGELIFRYIYEAAHSSKPVQRLWISSLTPDAIRDGLARLRDWSEYNNLADAAKGRSRADWLVGMNLSRAYSIACDEQLSVGRVQTPTLAMIVERELAIRAFVPEDYRIITAEFSPREGQSYDGTWFRQGVEPLETAMRLPPDGEEAKAIVERVRRGEAAIDRIESQTKRMPPPLLYDLTELQRHANRLFGFSAQRTLDLAQALYERHKLISYPRTDSRYLSTDVAKTLPKVTAAITGAYAGLVAPGTGQRPLNKRYVDDSKVSDHHAIIPTGVSPESVSIDADERRIFDLICRRLLQAWHDEYVWSITTVITRVTSEVQDWFHSRGTAVLAEGWKKLDLAGGRKEKKRGEDSEDTSDDAGQSLPPDLAPGQPQRILDVESVEKKTRPPKRFTEGTLLTAMETAGRSLDDKELSDAMKENGLGTPATRAQIIEVLLKREFIERSGKSLQATDKGIRLIEVVHPEVKSPIMTGQWEAFLKRIERGNAPLDGFLRGIEDYVRDVVGKTESVGRGPREPLPKPVAFRGKEAIQASPTGDRLTDVLRSRFGFDSFRPNQEAVCRALTAGDDVLLVMPTGSGKSLCYQLPGLVLGGTTLVISPLIALIEDQVAKLQSFGFAAERIHSGRDRGTSRQVCQSYLEGKLDFLFVAPERMKVPGFPEMLARRKPALVAIDEAHCISQWGHDFRPDYRTLGRYLPALRPAPAIALTATATPLVQNDIAQQLGLNIPRRFIHGFRRENIAIEIVKVNPTGRLDLTSRLLASAGRKPAIVYTPRRRDAEDFARELKRVASAAAYHAGLDPRRREEVQSRFLSGNLDVIVATIAFGMGVDKPDVRTVIHTAIPGSVEGYYQEIGRAGRDGKPSRAILMHAYSDRFTHDYFLERDYPDPSVLDRVFRRLGPSAHSKENLERLTGLAGEELDIALEKLWIHGGAAVDYAENVSRGADDWRESYIAQREHKIAQFERMLSYSETAGCRMLSLVRYFGDEEDRKGRCGICDVCDAKAAEAQEYREPTASEVEQAQKVIAALKVAPNCGTGRLHTQIFADGSLDRNGFEQLLGAMARSGLVEISEDSFEKDGKRIDFRRARLTQAGRNSNGQLSLLFPAEVEDSGRRRGRRKGAAKKSGAKKSGAKKAAKPADAKSRQSTQVPVVADSLAADLKAWRLAEAKRKGVPAFRIFPDRVLDAIVETRPQTTSELLQISGVGLSLVEKYGAQIFRIIEKQGGAMKGS